MSTGRRRPGFGISTCGEPMRSECATCGDTLTVSNAIYRHRKNRKPEILIRCRDCDSKLLKLKFQTPEAKAARSEIQKRSRQKIRRTVLAAYGNRCQCCGEQREEFLAIDHVEGGGAEQRRSIRSSTDLCRWLIKNGFPEKFRILCHNCNQSRGWYGYCPHERERSASALDTAALSEGSNSQPEPGPYAS